MNIKSLLLLGPALLLASCIDDYELPESDTRVKLVINGQIVSGQDCLFTVRSTILSNTVMQLPPYISGASITVRGTDGQEFVGHELTGRQGHYIVPVGELDPSAQYHASISTRFGLYESQPMQPLDAPELTELTYEQPREDRLVDLLVTTASPQGPVCLLWQVDEYWEIRTPFETHWEYRLDPGTSTYDPAASGQYVQLTPEEYTNHGWRHEMDLSAFATNEDYANGAISHFCIGQHQNTDHRFRKRFCAHVTQMAISREEYEYRHLQRTLSTEMGGLFTQMPSELPSNIRLVQSWDFDVPGASSSYYAPEWTSLQAIGYVGVRGKVGRGEIYINRSDVGYETSEIPEYVPQEDVKPEPFMLNLGYRVVQYNPTLGEAIWTQAQWVDYRHEHWGGGEALDEKPAWWQEPAP